MKSILLAAALAASALPATRPHKLTRILALEDARSLGSGELERYLADSDAGVRRRAALAAGRLQAGPLVPGLVTLLDDPMAEVRQMAAFALGLIRDRAAAPRLVTCLGDPDPVVRARAAEALGRLGDRAYASEIARMVLASLPRGARHVTVRGDDAGSPTDPWLDLRLGLFALAALKDAKALETVLLVDGQPRFDWWAAAYVAAAVPTAATSPVATAATRSTDPLSRTFGVRGLAAGRDTSVIDVLTPLLGDREENVAVGALQTLGRIGDARAVPLALSALVSSSPAVKQEALAALALCPLDRSQRDLIVPYVGHPDAAVRAAAIEALSRTDAEQLALVLSGSDADPAWQVRADLTRALRSVGGDIALGLIFGSLADADRRVLPAALESLARMRGPDAAETLRKYQHDDDPAIRATAVRELAALRVPDAPAILSTAYEAGLHDTDLVGRLAVLEALRGDTGPAATPLLQRIATTDPAEPLRASAAALLRSRGLSVPTTARLPRPVVDYRLAMTAFTPLRDAPVFTPRVFFHTTRGSIELHLNVVEAPMASGALAALVLRGFYNGLSFYRVRPGIAVETGCPRGDGWGGPGFSLQPEIGERPVGRGAVVLSPVDGLEGSGASRLLITLAPDPSLDGQETLVAWIAAGFETLAKLRPGDIIDRAELWDGQQ